MSEDFSTPFGNISELKEEAFFEKELYEYIFGIDDIFQKEKVQVELLKKAKELKVEKNFNKLYKECKKQSEKNKPTQLFTKHNEIGEYLLEQFDFVVYADSLYVYQNGVYTTDKNIIENEIIKVNPEANTYLRKEVINYIKIKVEKKENITQKENIINFKNNLYDINANIQLSHTPTHFSVNQLPINYIKDIENNEDYNYEKKEVEKYLNAISCNNIERKKALTEMIGYCMTTSTKKQVMFLLYGKKAENGKSTFIKILQKLIGVNNYSMISLKNMSNDKFTIAEVTNKLLNTTTENTDELIKDTSILKAIITGDLTPTELKNIQKRNYIQPYVKCVYPCNELPKTNNHNTDFYRRLFIIPLEAQFTLEEKNKFNINSLMTEKALEYLAYISLKAYKQVIDKPFSNYKESEEIKRIYILENNSVLAYFEDDENLMLLLKNGKIYKKRLLYEDYKIWCNNNDYKYIGEREFIKKALEKKFVVEGNLNDGYKPLIIIKEI